MGKVSLCKGSHQSLFASGLKVAEHFAMKAPAALHCTIWGILPSQVLLPLVPTEWWIFNQHRHFFMYQKANFKSLGDTYVNFTPFKDISKFPRGKAVSLSLRSIRGLGNMKHCYWILGLSSSGKDDIRKSSGMVHWSWPADCLKIITRLRYRVRRLIHPTIVYCVPVTCKALSQLVRDSAPKGMHTEPSDQVMCSENLGHVEISIAIQSERRSHGLHGGGGCLSYLNKNVR